MADAPVLALDIGEDAVAGVLFSESKRVVSIHAAHCCFLTKQTELKQALGEVVEQCKARGMRSLVSMSASHFHFRTFRLPFTDRKKIVSVLPLEIQDNVSFADESFIFDYMLEPGVGDESEILAILVKKNLLREWLDLLLDYDLDPELLTVSGLASALNICRFSQTSPDDLVLLQIGFTSAMLFLIKNRSIKAMRALAYNIDQRAGIHYSPDTGTVRAAYPPQAREVLDHLTVEVHNTLLLLNLARTEEETIPLGINGLVGNIRACRDKLTSVLPGGVCDTDWLGGVEIENMEEVKKWPSGVLDQALGLVCSTGKDRERVNFRKEEFAWGGGSESVSRALRIGIAGAIVLLIALVSYQIFDYQQLKHQRDNLARQITTAFEETVPGGKAGSEPVKALQVKVNELKETAGIGSAQTPTLTTVNLLADISERIPESLKVTFERFIYDRKSVRVRGLTDNFNSVDMMKKSLEKSPYFTKVEIGSANLAPKEQGVRFELNLDL